MQQTPLICPGTLRTITFIYKLSSLKYFATVVRSGKHKLCAKPFLWNKSQMPRCHASQFRFYPYRAILYFKIIIQNYSKNIFTQCILTITPVSFQILSIFIITQHCILMKANNKIKTTTTKTNKQKTCGIHFVLVNSS